MSSRTSSALNAAGQRLVELEAEVQESRRLIADLLAMHSAGPPPTPGFVMTFCEGCDDPWPCPTVDRIEQATQPEEGQ